MQIAESDSKLVRLQNELVQIDRNSKLEVLRLQSLKISDELLSIHAESENLVGELEKVLKDLELVEKRISNDKNRISKLTSDREVKAINLELDSLADRKDNLENSELELLEKKAKVDSVLKNLGQEKAQLSLEIEEYLKAENAIKLSISSEIGKLNSSRNDQFESLPELLKNEYSKRALRQTPVGQIVGRNCTACNLTINSTELGTISSEASDRIPLCPNCNAMLIR